MKRLVWFELRKTLCNGRSLGIYAACLLFSCIAFLVGNPDVWDNAETAPYIGAALDPAIVQKVETAMRPGGSLDGISESRTFLSVYQKYMDNVESYRNGDLSNPIQPILGISALESQLVTLEPNSYAYKNAVKNLLMLQAKGEPRFYMNDIWKNDTSGNAYAMCLLFAVIPLGFLIAPSFTRENSSGMNHIILSSRNGRRRIAYAKLINAILVAVIWIGGMQLLHIIICLLQNGLSTIQYPMDGLYALSHTPYAWSNLEFLPIRVGYMLVIGVSFALFVSMISATQRSVLTSLGLTAVLLLYPALFTMMPDHTVTNISYLGLFHIEEVFGTYTAYNVFGQPILYPMLGVLVASILALPCVWIVLRLQRKRIAL